MKLYIFTGLKGEKGDVGFPGLPAHDGLPGLPEILECLDFFLRHRRKFCVSGQSVSEIYRRIKGHTW
uniref:Uncharacterized protein n=1 Tax=Meloidogyne incognita TaxID=6306 RepID=A0A914MFG2_MELIC